MDIFENLFGKGASIWAGRRRAAEEARAATFEDEFQALSLLARAACEGHSLELRAVDGPGFLQGEFLALPAREFRFSTTELNRFVLFHKALGGGAMRFLGESSAPEERLRHLEAQFAGFRSWHESGKAALAGDLGASVEAGPSPWLWVEQRPAIPREMRPPPPPGRRGRNESRSEKEAKRPGEVETVDLEKEKKDQNPVMHSFEKLETADEYRGGHRITDASDQLEEHSAALDELNLNKVTRSGDNAQSVYRAEVSELFSSEETELSAEKESSFLWYPEWDYKKSELKPRHCRLYTAKPTEPGDGAAWKSRLQESYSSELLLWEQRWLGIVNERTWKNRQWDGEQLDVDAYVRYQADLRSSGQGDARVFLRRQHGERNLSTLILLDQSYSTDSYVDGKRVLDVELDSIGLSGLLLEKLGDPVAVAGTWSETRSHCYFQTYKSFRAPWADFQAHAPRIEPQGYTRLGPAIRHATRLLSETGARTKLLILLTDGKPTDYDRYEGRYGIEDIFHSFLEAKQKGVEVKALAIEKDAKHYFPRLFGPRNYKILPSPRLLPESLFHLYLEASRL